MDLKLQTFWYFIREKIKNSILKAEALILELALFLIFVTMSTAKHPANMVPLTESKQFVHISALL